LHSFLCRAFRHEVGNFRTRSESLRLWQSENQSPYSGKEFEPKAYAPTPGALDLCFITTRTLEEVTETFQTHGVEIIEGPVARTGATGPIRSVYVRDPDLNLIEIAVYPADART